MLIPPTRVGVGVGHTNGTYMLGNHLFTADSHEPACELRDSGVQGSRGGRTYGLRG